MSLSELYEKSTRSQLPTNVQLMQSTPGSSSRFAQRDSRPAGDRLETVRDSIHLDLLPLTPGCPECGVRVRVWDGFAHRVLWNRTFLNAAAFQPVSTRFETDRWDSPIEGFAFRLWEWPSPGNTFILNRRRRVVRTSTFPGSSSTTASSLNHNEDGEDDEDEEEESILSRSSSSTYYNNNEEEDDESRRRPRYPNEWLSNMIPFGRVNLGRRNLLSVETTRFLNVTESIFYGTLKHTTPRFVRLYSHRLLQACEPRRDDGDSRYYYRCQPHFDTQPNSSK